MGGMFENTNLFNQPLDGWDVTSVLYMDDMFRIARAFNQDLSVWNVNHIASKPDGFDAYVNGWTLPKPVWGTTGVIV